MDKRNALAIVALLLAVFAAGCLAPTQQPQAPVDDTAVGGVEASSIVVPDINESEADFPSPV
jgi:hypothetical protein